MRLAIEEAWKSKEPFRCGAVIVKGKDVIANSCNSPRTSKDASAHAEINAIRHAGKKLGNKYLDGCRIYSTCEPCVMCLSALVYARIGKIIYGIRLKELSSKPIDIDIDTFLSKSPHRIKIVKGFMEKECRELL